MIGGVDTFLPTRAGDAALEAAVRAVRLHWPHSVFEDAETGDLYAQFWQIPFGTLQEIFVYRDQSFATAWEAKGAVPELHNTMVHIISDDDAVCVVVDDKNQEMSMLIAAIASALSDDILNSPALLEAA